MDAIRTLGMSLCITIVITALFSMLVPNTRLEKALKFAVSLFFLTSLVSPFFSGNLEFRLDVSASAPPMENRRLEQSMETQFSALAGQRLAAAIESLLRAASLPVENVRVETTISGESLISISGITVTASSSDALQREQIAEIVRRETGVTPAVTDG